MEYNPQDYAKLLQPILNNKADIVLGSRFVNQKLILFGKNKTKHRLHWIGNKTLTFIFNVLYSTSLTDIEPCYKLFKSNVLKNVEVASNRFEYDIELMCKAVKNGYKTVQLPISFNPRSYEEGKKISTWKDGIIAFITIIKNRF